MDGTWEQLVELGLASLPQILFALALLVGGLFVGWLLKFVAEAMLRSLGVDGLAERSGMARALKQATKTDYSISQVAGLIVFWTVFLIFFASALRAVGLGEISEWMGDVARFLPRVLGAFLLVFGGIFAGRLVQDLFVEEGDRRESQRAWSQWTPEAWAQLARGSQAVVVSVAVILALLLLGIDLAPLVWLLVVVLAGVGATAVISWGPILRERTRNREVVGHLRTEIEPGTLVRVGEAEGFVTEMGQTHLILQTTEGQVHLPYSYVEKQPIEVITVGASDEKPATLEF
ncbi:MAG: hypothetical protein PVF47_19315 [Anaerolineae bacterium]|jgi:hypothetical protein